MAGAQRKHDQVVQAPCTDRLHYMRESTSLLFKYSKEGTSKDGREVSAGFTCLNLPRKSAADPPSCPKTCTTCSAHYRPLSWQENFEVLRYKEVLDDEAAAAVVAELVKETKDNLARVADLISACGDAIIRRWRRRSPSKRARLLQDALPDMLKQRTHAPRRRQLCCGDLAQYKVRLCLPYLDIESLSEQPLHLLALLHHRSSTPPSDWVMHDSSHLKAPFGLGTVEATYNPHCVEMLDDDEFGTLKPWDRKSAHEWHIIGFPLAKLILETQNTLSVFLLRIVQSLLQLEPLKAESGSIKWQTLVEVDFQERVGLFDDSISYRLPPAFRKPEGLSLEQVVETCETRHAASKDECYLLQTDPAFTRQLLAVVQSSGVYDQANTQRRKIQLLSPFFYAVARQETWKLLHSEATYVLEAFREHGEESTKYIDALRILDRSLRSDFDQLLSYAKSIAIQCGTFDRLLGFSGDKTPVVKDKGAYKDLLFHSFDKLKHHDFEDADYPGIHLQAIEALAYGGKGEKQLPLNQMLVECISDLSAIDEVVMAIHYQRPNLGPHLPRKDVPPDSTEIHQESLHYADFKYQIYVEYHWHRDLNGIYPPLQAFMSKPLLSDKVRRKTLQDFDVAHDALQGFWSAVRAEREKMLTLGGCPANRLDILMKIVCEGLSAEYQSERTQERRLLQEAVEAKEAVARIRDHRLRGEPSTSSRLPVIQQVWGESVDRLGSHSASPRVKVKTRRVSTFPEEDGGQQEAENQELPEAVAQDKIPVSDASLDIFRRCFVSYGKRSNNNVRFELFARALMDAGMTPSQSTVGSAVTFRGEKGSMVVHKSHPVPTINPICMRSFGKRLAKAFGWSMDTFVSKKSRD